MEGLGEESGKSGSAKGSDDEDAKGCLLARVRKGEKSGHSRRGTGMWSVDVALEFGVEATLCGRLRSTAGEAIIMAMLEWWFLKEKERGRPRLGAYSRGAT